ncbi:hypothetical protein P078_0043 [Lactococcus phage P078]|uniref:Uncharacterized protein n=1 Tax=Lactococcus phage P078 TaxID=1476886 RepID=X4Y7L2_9CAUD|nr:hypothetical protein GJ21_gp43 [Lactococcus phage P078]AHV83006.1 hypothetical protein P078_0043 [Lactococcus phage P078]
MEKKELLEVIESYKKQPFWAGYMDRFTNALHNGKVTWFIKTAGDVGGVLDDYVYPIGTVMPCHGHITPDDTGSWDVLGITEAGKLVQFKGEAIETK